MKSEHDLAPTGVVQSSSKPAKPQNYVENPLAGKSKEELFTDVEQFCNQFSLSDHLDDFKRGALLAQSPERLLNRDDADLILTEEERTVLEREKTHRWSQTFTLYWLCVMCSVAAAVEGMDETVVNGAQALFLEILGIAGPNITRYSPAMQNYLTGVIVGAPFLSAGLVGSWLTEPLNRYLGRRGATFVSCFIAAVSSIWQAVSNSWVNLLISRLFLGLAIGPKSSTVPVYAAECAPAPIRGALVMQWQVWTAFGVMLGNIVGVAFGPSTSIAPNLGWRLMMGSACILPLFVCAQVFFCPESPRWYINRNQPEKAFRSFQRLRFTNIQAARDTYYTYVGVQMENKIYKRKSYVGMLIELFRVPRNRRAALASWILMFGQQLCGINVISYYSTTIFTESGFSTTSALLASMGTGIINFVFALPAVFTIDRWGRRALLLSTFPFLSLTLLWTGMSFYISNANTRMIMVTVGLYLYEVWFSPGEGPLPFTYSAEVFPVYIRDIGMSFATATTWCFSFIITFAWPQMLTAFGNQGAFGWYAAWCAVLWGLILLFVPETKALTLEELDQVFNVGTREHAVYQLRYSWWCVKKYVFFQKIEPPQPLYGFLESEAELRGNEVQK